ncbi:MAG: alcohol dehydrogenase catalytic domain-containing protein [Candidatus Binataceae bacterium]
MKAAVFHGPRDVRVESVPDPKLGSPTDAIVRITRAAICGSDLHYYQGRIPAIAGFVLGHEGVGIVEEVGRNVTTLKRGRRVVVSGVVACGSCFYCRRGQESQCETCGSVVFGYGKNVAGKLGEVGGAQSEALCVPMADYTCYPLPDAIDDDAAVFLADILPTGFFGASNGNIVAGDTVAVFGCGPVGLCTIMAAQLFGAAEVIAVDSLPYRLELAVKLGATAVTTAQAAETILARTGGRGADVTIEAVGHESALQSALMTVRPGGTVSAIGVFSEASFSFPIGLAFVRDLTFRMGLANIRSHIPRLASLIEHGRLDPRPLISHRLALSDAPRGYQIFDARSDNAVKVLLKP